MSQKFTGQESQMDNEIWKKITSNQGNENKNRKDIQFHICYIGEKDS